MCQICEGCGKINSCDDNDCITSQSFLCESCEKTWGWCSRKEKYVDKSQLCNNPKMLIDNELNDFCLRYCILWRTNYSTTELQKFVDDKIYYILNDQSFNDNDRQLMIRLFITTLQDELKKMNGEVKNV